MALAVSPEHLEALSVDRSKQSTLIHHAHQAAGQGAHPAAASLHVYGRRVLLLIGETIVGEAQLPRDLALVRLVLDGPELAVSQARLRYLEDPERAVDCPVRNAATPPRPPPPWLATRQADLAKRIDIGLDEIALREAVAHMTRLSGVTISLDPSAEALAELPVSVAGRGMSVDEGLAWLERLTGAQRELTAEGVRLVWR